MYTKIYDEEYLKRFEERAATELGRKIYAERWRLIEKYCEGEMTLLDYGCATGAFHESSVNGFKTYGYDINPHSSYNAFPKDKPIEILTMWDVIEHLPDPVGVVMNINPQWLFLSTPNLESVRGDIRAWRHYRPKEHLYYFDKDSLQVILDSILYEIVETNFGEGELRDPLNPEAIISVVARRMQNK